MVKTIYSRSENLQTLLDSQVGGTFWTLNPKLIGKNGKNILEEILPENISESESFEMRTNHYPFSSRDSSKWVDISIQRCIRSGNASEKGGVTVDFSEIDLINIKQSRPQHSPTKAVAITSLRNDENKQIDITHSAHAVNGGIVVDEWGSTEINGLFAVGETIAGPHGADRLGGGMISQSCVYGKRVGEKAASYSSEIDLGNYNDEKIQNRLEKFNNSNGPSYNTIRKELKTLAKNYLVVERNGTGLNFMDKRINELINDEITNAPFSGNIRLIKNLETENLLTVARLMVKSATMRKESRGSHCRLDYQNIDNKSWNKSIFWNLENGKLKYGLKQYRQEPNNVKQLS
jgi:succinate dehydrogenase/fumarate reductase flavoprotein subunit